MNRLFYDPLGGPSGAGGGEKEIPAEELERIEKEAVEAARLQFHPDYSRDAFTACVICYRQGAKAEYRRRLSPSPGLRWVKASERLPKSKSLDRENQICVRNDSIYYAAAVYCEDGFYLLIEDRWYSFVTPLDQIEWLEETPSPSPGLTKESAISLIEDYLIEAYGGLSKDKDGREIDTPYTVLGIVRAALDRAASPSLPGEQEDTDQAALWDETDVIYERAEDWAEIRHALMSKYTIARKTSAPQAEKGEQVEGKGETAEGDHRSWKPAYEYVSKFPPDDVYGHIRQRAFVAGAKWADSTPRPSVEADQQDARKRGLKAFDDSMKNTLGELTGPEGIPFAEPEAGQQKPPIGDSLVKWLNAQGPQTDQQGEIPKMSDQLAAESDMAAIDYGQVCEKFIGSSPYDNTHITEAFEQGQSWMYRKLQPEIATLRSSAKSSIYQHDQDMEIVKGERDELKDALESWVNAHDEFVALGERVNYSVEEHMKAANAANMGHAIAKQTLNKFTNKEDNEKGGQAGNI